VSESERKYELECLRLAADCTDLARDVLEPALQAHFKGLAEAWTAAAECGPGGLAGLARLN
jgi:hypothetical protein